MLPYYPFSWGDYSVKTAGLSQSQHGAYMLFLCYIYRTGQPIEDRRRYHIAMAFTDDEKEAADYVLGRFFILELGFWKGEDYQKMLDVNRNFLYVIFLENKKEKFIKIGITSRLKRRFSDFKKLGYKVSEIEVKEFSDLDSVKKEERALHQKFSSKKYNPEIDFGGKTECFFCDILEEIKK